MVSLKELDGRIQRIDWKLTALAVALYVLGAWLAYRGQYEGASIAIATASGWMAQAHWDRVAGRRPPGKGWQAAGIQRQAPREEDKPQDPPA